MSATGQRDHGQVPGGVRWRAYVSSAEGQAVSVVAIDPADGRLQLLQTLSLPGSAQPMALHRLADGGLRLLVALRSAPFAVHSLAIDPDSGRLTPLAAAPVPESLAHIAVHPGGRWLLGASYGAHAVTVSPLDADGRPGPVQAVWPTGRHAHMVRFSPDGRRVHIPCLGSDAVLCWPFDVDTGALQPGAAPAPLATPVGSGPRHLVLAPQGGHAWLLHELDGAVAQLAVRPDGGLRAVARHDGLPPGFGGEPWAADLRASADGRWLASSERRSHTLALWRVDAATGALALAGHAPTEAQPRGIAWSPAGGWLLAAGQRSHALASYRLDADRGKLRPADRLALPEGPNWIETLALPP